MLAFALFSVGETRNLKDFGLNRYFINENSLEY